MHHAAAGTVLAGLVVDVFARLLALPHHLLSTALGMVFGLSDQEPRQGTPTGGADPRGRREGSTGS